MSEPPLTPSTEAAGPTSVPDSTPSVAPEAAVDGGFSSEPAPFEDFGSRSFSPEHQPWAEWWGGHFKADGVDTTAASAAADWFTSFKGAGEARKHSYDLRGFGFSDADAPLVDAFGNAMAKAGASADSVYAILRRYSDLSSPKAIAARVEHSRHAEAEDKEARNALHVELAGQWGNDTAANLKLVRQHVRSLSQSERARVAADVDARGAAAMADLLAKVRAPSGNRSDVNSKIAELEKLMRTDRKSYNLREAEYRQLLEQRGR